MSDKTYAQFNTITITGRLSHAEVVQGQYGEFLAVTLLSELVNDSKAIAVQFNNANGLLTLFKTDRLLPGRSITVTGHLAGFAETYFDKKEGKVASMEVFLGRWDD